jgi:alkylation response protein AidB-like acyl-CoA dehydrogenase
MLLAVSSDQEFFRETTERFLVEQAPPNEVRRLRGDSSGFDADYWRRGAELGWTSLLVSEDHGGGTISGAGLVDLSLVAYEFGRHASPGPLLPTNVVAGALSARDAQTEVLAGLLAGTEVAAWCAPELAPALGAWAPTVDIRHDGAELVVHGAARPVESAGQAGHLLVTGRGDGDGRHHPGASPGVAPRGCRSSRCARRISPGASGGHLRRRPGVKATRSLGCRGGLDGRRVAVPPGPRHPQRRVGRAMQAAFDMTVEWAFDRYAFGRPLASYQALKHRFADMLTWLEASHAISDAACAAT